MFNLHDFVYNTILKMIGNTADYQVMQYSLGWYEKEVLIDEDMEAIQKKIEEHNTPNIPESIETEPIEIMAESEE